MKIKNFLNIFFGFFVIVNENSQFNVIKGINKNSNGNISLSVGPVNEDVCFEMSPYQVIKHNIFIKQFSKTDVKLIKSLLISEGDIFITAKKYHCDSEVLTLESPLDHKSWEMTKEELIKNKDIFSRLNAKYFSRQLDLI